MVDRQQAELWISHATLPFFRPQYDRASARRPWAGGQALSVVAGVGLVQRDYIECAAYLRDEMGIELPDFRDQQQVPRGGIVGVVTLVDCVVDHPSRFFTGPHGLVLANARPLPFVPWKGQLGWFDVPRSAVGLPALEVA